MRLAIVSDIHGNVTALEAVVEDLRTISPDVILHGGDLAHGGARPVEVIDRIADLGWQGVLGNTDEMLFRPESLTEFAQQSAAGLESVFRAVGEVATATREALGPQRLAWLQTLPRVQSLAALSLVHASPESLWRAPSADSTDADLSQTYAPLGRTLAVYAHIHHPFVRKLDAMTVANTGSVSLSHNGDPRAAYLLLDQGSAVHPLPQIRRVAYDMNQELSALAKSGLPHAGWIARSLASARPQMP
jgi:predicted phosphodiesterase